MYNHFIARWRKVIACWMRTNSDSLHQRTLNAHQSSSALSAFVSPKQTEANMRGCLISCPGPADCPPPPPLPRARHQGLGNSWELLTAADLEEPDEKFLPLRFFVSGSWRTCKTSLLPSLCVCLLWQGYFKYMCIMIQRSIPMDDSRSLIHSFPDIALLVKSTWWIRRLLQHRVFGAVILQCNCLVWSWRTRWLRF